MQLITGTISRAELERMAAARFGDFVKAVVDVRRGCMAVDAELHADEEAFLLEAGARQEGGINLYPGLGESEWVEFDSMINLRPGQGNRSRGVERAELRACILETVRKLAPR
jgi:hypothetical protein